LTYKYIKGSGSVNSKNHSGYYV